MSIETVIKQRLKLQSTANSLFNDFGVEADFNHISSRLFYSNFCNWDIKKQSRFINLLGGAVNYAETLNYLKNKI